MQKSQKNLGYKEFNNEKGIEHKNEGIRIFYFVLFANQEKIETSFQQ